ncbi:MAG: hypothetical protein WDA71_07670 [Actinomycetota bacterium]
MVKNSKPPKLLDFEDPDTMEADDPLAQAVAGAGWNPSHYLSFVRRRSQAEADASLEEAIEALHKRRPGERPFWVLPPEEWPGRKPTRRSAPGPDVAEAPAPVEPKNPKTGKGK